MNSRTTLILPDELMRELKRRVAERGETLSAVVEETPGGWTLRGRRWRWSPFRPTPCARRGPTATMMRGSSRSSASLNSATDGTGIPASRKACRTR